MKKKEISKNEFDMITYKCISKMFRHGLRLHELLNFVEDNYLSPPTHSSNRSQDYQK